MRSEYQTLSHQNVIVKNTMLSYLNTHKYILTYRGGKIHEIENVLRDGRQHSNITDVLSFSGSDSDTNH